MNRFPLLPLLAALVFSGAQTSGVIVPRPRYTVASRYHSKRR